MGLPDGLDLVLTVQNYHDLHLKPFPAATADAVNKQVFKALKPGGLYVVVDHAAAAGAPGRTGDAHGGERLANARLGIRCAHQRRRHGDA